MNKKIGGLLVVATVVGSLAVVDLRAGEVNNLKTDDKPVVAEVIENNNVHEVGEGISVGGTKPLQGRASIERSVKVGSQYKETQSSVEKPNNWDGTPPGYGTVTNPEEATTLNGYRPQLEEDSIWLSDPTTETATPSNTYLQEDVLQYAIYLGNGLFTGLGGSPLATMGHTRVNFNQETNQDALVPGLLYQFTTDGVVQLSYPSKITGKDLNVVKEPVQIEVSNSILNSANEFKKDVKLEVINVGQYNRVTGETKITLADIYNMKKVKDPNTILVVTGTDRLQVEQASQLLAERGAKLILKVTNFVKVKEGFEESVKEWLKNLEYFNGDTPRQPFNIEDAAPDVIYYA